MRRLVSNPPNRWQEAHVEWLEPAPDLQLEVSEIQAKSILSRNDSPDLPFEFSLNPYQGCYHGCVYCYARPSHQYLGLGAGTDFERKLNVKVNAPELLRAAFARPSWRGAPVLFSGNTDCYQPLEASYQLTRRCLETCLEFQNPVTILSKGVVLMRDVQLLAELARQTSVSVYVTIPFLDEEVRRAIEPYAAPLDRRLEILRVLSALGVRTGVALAPIIPGLNESDIPELLGRARAAGAQQAFMSLLRLPAEVKAIFLERIGAALHPKRVERIESALLEMRGGRLQEGRFGHRMAGQGKRWAMVEQLFEAQCRRLGLHTAEQGWSESASTFRRPKRQLELF